ncbi:MAG: DUF1294 domain-containing protein [Bacteroidales bacterium]|nr:DUF1294 domain-containing protein [Bacteroidales bacterium]MBQ3677864.1 DUF1294 domain-containing protein [Bacteroidales bacterium]MBR7036068.1 DUF1294 domain-containing protein [Bacteroidales bacterium]
METNISTIILYLLAINIAAFIAFGIDKYKAKRDKWRIPESTLLTMAVLGGSIGALAGMKIWRHKTLHNKFRIGIPVILALQIIVIIWWNVSL